MPGHAGLQPDQVRDVAVGERDVEHLLLLDRRADFRRRRLDERLARRHLHRLAQLADRQLGRQAVFLADVDDDLVVGLRS